MTNDEQIKALIEAGERVDEGEFLHDGGYILHNRVCEGETYRVFEDLTCVDSYIEYFVLVANSREAIRAMHEENKQLREIAEEMALVEKTLKSINQYLDENFVGILPNWVHFEINRMCETLTKFNAIKETK